MNPTHVICRGGAHDNERYPLPSAATPGYVFAWDGHETKAYRIQPEIVRTNRGPMWIATPVPCQIQPDGAPRVR